MKKARLFAPLKSSGKTRRRLLILCAVLFVFALSWASFREFQAIARDGAGLSAVDRAVEPEKTSVRGKESVHIETDLATENDHEDEHEDEHEDDIDDSDDVDYYGGEVTVRSDVEELGQTRDWADSIGTEAEHSAPDESFDVDPPPGGEKNDVKAGVKLVKETEANLKQGGEKRNQLDRNQSDGSAAMDSDGGEDNEKTFTVMSHTEFWGDALVWGDSNLVATAAECSHACATYKPTSENDPPCNVWVYCGDETLCRSSGAYKQCWLKNLAHPDGARPASEGPTVGWTSGILLSKDARGGQSATSPSANDDRSYHVVISAQGQATHWQSRIHYYWYLKTRKECRELAEVDGTTCDMGGFTRLLHEDKPDDLMDEIPTFVAKTLPKEHPHHGYIVLNRPYAFLQWVQQATIKEKYVLMGEPDHIWLKPMQNPMVGDTPAAFPFFYIEPTSEKNIAVTERFVGKLDSLEKKIRLFPIGSSPTIMSMEDMKRVVPVWYDLSLKVHDDDDAVELWGWVQEMYAFSMAMYKAGLHEVSLLPDMMAQPPWDWDKSRYTLLHYTYGMDYTLEGVFTPGKVGEWHWDKRDFKGPIPRDMEGPPEGTQNELVKDLINRVRHGPMLPGCSSLPTSDSISPHFS